MNALWFRLAILVSSALFFTACTQQGSNPPPVEDADDGPVVTDDDDLPVPEPETPVIEEPEVVETLAFDLDFFPAGDLLPGSTSVQGDTGVVTNEAVAPFMRFPVERGPAFLNSQIFGKGGGGYIDSRWPPVSGSENDLQNFKYPWRDNFCEVRLDTSKHTNPYCPAGLGHQGQDIRPASCANGVHWAVAPEDVEVRNIANLHLVNLYGLETGTMYTMLHLDRPLANTVAGGVTRPIQRGDTIARGARIGRISDVITAPNPASSVACEREGRCTTVHLHFEIRQGVTRTGSISSGKAINSVSPYNSLVQSYLRLVNSAPAGEDWTSTVPQPPMSACLRP